MTLTETQVSDFPLYRGKVRDMYDIGNGQLVMVATDRISAFDSVLPTPIPDKGKILTQISAFWMRQFWPENHILSLDLADMPMQFRQPEFEGRTTLVRKTKVVPFECIVRGHLAGSAWYEYEATGKVAGVEMPPGLQQNCQFPRPVFTPSTKEATGHDLNVSFKEMERRLVPLFPPRDDGPRFTPVYDLRHPSPGNIAHDMRKNSLELFSEAQEYAWHRGLLLADTKFEWGVTPEGRLILVDEALTPDSSRFWQADQHVLGVSVLSFDKQYVRDHLDSVGWNRRDDPPALPQGVVDGVRAKYLHAYYTLTGKGWS